jgi:hypothetical protein
MARTDLDCLIGIVGYSPVLDAYPLGPLLMQSLQRRLAGKGRFAVENMTWGPIHIVQHFQDETGPRQTRVVLVGAAGVSKAPGAVRAYRWIGGHLTEIQLQERIYEAVTGVVDIDNTLAIGDHFRIWPNEVFAVEIDMPASTFGDMVMADSEGDGREEALTRRIGFSPAAAIDDLCDLCESLALGAGGALTLAPKSATPLGPSDRFTRYHQIAR